MKDDWFLLLSLKKRASSVTVKLGDAVFRQLVGHFVSGTLEERIVSQKNSTQSHPEGPNLI